QNGTAEQKRAGQVYVEDALPVGKLGFDHGAARIVWRGAADQDVEPPERVIRRIADGSGFALARNVASPEKRTPTALSNEPLGLRCGGRIDIAAGDGGPFLGKRERYRSTDAAPRAADQRRLSRQLLHALPLCSKHHGAAV